MSGIRHIVLDNTNSGRRLTDSTNTDVAFIKQLKFRMSELVNMLSSLTTELFETDKRNLQMTRVLLLIYVH